MKIFSGRTPSISAFCRAGSTSSPWPRSAVKVTTSARYSVCSHLRMIEVSRPPEYASTTFVGELLLIPAPELEVRSSTVRPGLVEGLPFSCKGREAVRQAHRERWLRDYHATHLPLPGQTAEAGEDGGGFMAVADREEQGVVACDSP